MYRLQGCLGRMAPGLLREKEKLVAMRPIEIDDEHYRELDNIENDRLSAASAGVDAGYGNLNPGAVRYVFYRRKGYCKTDALSFALAWARNAVEQYDRRLQHDTGAEGWRPV